MMIDELIKTLTALRRTYGNIEVDVLHDNTYNAVQSGIPIRIDEFGDVIAVIATYSGNSKHSVETNELLQNDSWLKMKTDGESDTEAIAKWNEAGQPSRMSHKDLVPDNDTRPLMAYLVTYNTASGYRSALYHESVNSGRELFDEIRQVVGTYREVDGVFCLGNSN